ncbi:MAG: NmrA family NAD(P)-binding protein [Saprospirales bacterium]|nr:NmrA family NAD(P)-binding protein [Saprospirales bacterium]MBK8490606.1 NmrA family NAD(P)-binding protein [Saprospirales bacterium]
MKILITGATGTVGSAVLEHLKSLGMDAVGAGRAAAVDTSWAQLDFAKTTTFRKALKGITHLFLVVPSGYKDAGHIQRFLDAAISFHVEHITFLSGRTTGDVPGRMLNTVEEQVRKCGLPYTILRPGWFMQNFALGLAEDIRQEGKIYLPAGDAKTAFVDVRDIAVAVEKTFLEKGHQGKTYDLVSQEAIDHYEVARLFSEALGRPVEYVDLSPTDFLSLMLGRGEGEEGLAAYIYLFDLVKTGKEARLSADLAELLGREPKRFGAFVGDYLAIWKQ